MENSNEVKELLIIKCATCGKEFELTPAEQKFFESKGFDYPKRCKECRDNRKQTEKYICVDCNKEFEVSGVEAEFYKKHNLEIPKRCPKCREYRKKQYMVEVSE